MQGSEARSRGGFGSRGVGACVTFVHRGLLALAVIVALCGVGAVPAQARGRLECVPYARSVSGIDIHGDAHLWWQAAAGTYQRGRQPEVGAVLAFRSTAAMPLGHVAVVARILDDRRVMLNHANWSRPGMIERGVLAQDVSPAGDWSQVRVWYAPSGALGLRANAAYGFIYARPATSEPRAPQLVDAADTPAAPDGPARHSR